MKSLSKCSFTDKILWRIRLLWLAVGAMLVYMVVVSELGGGDSRMMTRLAQQTSRIIFFGGLAYLGYRIYFNKKLLKNRLLLQEKQRKEQDERNQYLHDKSGGLVMDLLLVLLLFATCTSALFDMEAFFVSYILLAAAVLLKGAAYYCAHRGWI